MTQENRTTPPATSDSTRPLEPIPYIQGYHILRAHPLRDAASRLRRARAREDAAWLYAFSRLRLDTLIAAQTVRGMSGKIEQLSEPQHFSLQALLSYWETKKGERIAPSMDDIRPHDLVIFLPYMATAERVGGDWRILKFGSGLVRAYDGDLSGQLLSSADLGGIAEGLLAQLARVIWERRWNVIRVRFAKEHEQRYLEYERLAMPLATDGEHIDHVLCVFHIERAF